ncbi:MAG: sugar ABC transporter permease [Hyphomicrobiaceae bacterium]
MSVRSTAILFVAPALAALMLVLAYPIVYSIWLSFTNASLSAGELQTPFAGLDNYMALAGNRTARGALANTIYFTVVEVVSVVVLGLAMAMLLNHPMARSPILRVLLILPWAIAPVANAVLWKWILHSNYGIANAILLSTGAIERNVTWLGSPLLALNTMLLVDIWKSTPFITILLLAALQGIPSALYRAATIDGATAWQKFRHVTLPQLKTALAIAIVLQTIWSLRVFDLIFVLTKGGPFDSTIVLNFLAYRETFNFLKFGFGAAIANLIFLVSLVLAIIYLRLLRLRAVEAR